jgi:hypothetical protein
MFGLRASASQWSAHLLTSFWGVLNSILQQPGGSLGTTVVLLPAVLPAALVAHPLNQRCCVFSAPAARTNAESAGPLAAAIAGQPAAAAASLEWLARSGPFDSRPQLVAQPSEAELVRMARAIIAACAAGAGEPSAAAPASAAAAARATKAFIKAEADVACMLITWPKVLKPIAGQQQPPSAAWRALAELASAAAAIGRASALARKSKGADASAIKRGPGL